jgi:hypothetical protein
MERIITGMIMLNCAFGLFLGTILSIIPDNVKVYSISNGFAFSVIVSFVIWNYMAYKMVTNDPEIKNG